MTKSFSVVCANGLGDGLLMMILASSLKQADAKVDIYHPQHHLLKELFPNVNWKNLPPTDQFESIFHTYDKVYIENDNSANAWALIHLRREKKLQNLCFIFPTPCSKAHMDGDYTFDPQIPFATNLSKAAVKLLNLKKSSKNNDFFLNDAKNHRRFKTRVILHPTSQDPKRNWKKKQFLELAKHLKKMDLNPVFTVGPSEYKDWEDVISLGYMVKTFPSLKELCSYIYSSGYLIGNDSGLGHIASNCKLPTLTISGNTKRVKLWRPDFSLNAICTPRVPLPSFKGISFLFRENFWQYFVTVRKVLKEFRKLKKTYSEGCS